MENFKEVNTFSPDMVKVLLKSFSPRDKPQNGMHT